MDQTKIVFKVCPLPTTDTAYKFLYCLEYGPLQTVWVKGAIALSTILKTDSLSGALLDYAEAYISKEWSHIPGLNVNYRVADVVVEQYHIVKV